MQTFHFGSLLRFTIYVDIQHTVQKGKAHHRIIIYRVKPIAVMGERFYTLDFADRIDYSPDTCGYETGSYEIINKTGCNIQTKELRGENKWIVVANGYQKGIN